MALSGQVREAGHFGTDSNNGVALRHAQPSPQSPLSGNMVQMAPYSTQVHGSDSLAAIHIHASFVRWRYAMHRRDEPSAYIVS